MNRLHLGFSNEVEFPRGGFLYIGDEVPDVWRGRVFDPVKDNFNPLKGLSYKAARELADVLYVISPEGESTLTVRDGRRALAKALMDARRFDKVKAEKEVRALIDDVLLSPILRRVFCSVNGQFSFASNSKILARINRAELGEFDAFVLGAVLMNFYKGQVVVSDFGFYGRNVHAALIRENRLIAHVNFLSEFPPRLRKIILSIKDKSARGCLFEDAKVLAEFAGLTPNTNAFNDYVEAAMGHVSDR